MFDDLYDAFVAAFDDSLWWRIMTHLEKDLDHEEAAALTPEVMKSFIRHWRDLVMDDAREFFNSCEVRLTREINGYIYELSDESEEEEDTA